MAASLASISKPFAAPVPTAAARRSCRPARAVSVLAKATRQEQGSNTPGAIVAGALAASIVCLSGATAFPQPVLASAGSDETSRLVEKNTPDVTKSGSMQTNIPFQAPGSNAPPRGPAQEQGTNVGKILKRAGKQIKENYEDPDSTPFGVGKGPLVRDAKKASQPGRLQNLNKAAAERFVEQSSSNANMEEIEKGGKVVPRGYYPVYDKVSGKTGTTEK